MEKEQKKLLLVAVSVGVFLLVTITVAMIVMSPKVQTEGTSFSSSAPYSQRVQPASDIMDNIPIQPAVIETQASPDINTDETQTASSVPDINNGGNLTIQIPTRSTAGVPDNAEITPSTVTIAPSPEKPATPAVSAPAAVRPAQTAQPAAPKPAVRPSASASTPARPSTSGTINDFWVQTGAYSAIVRAEDAKELLATKGLVSIIENREVNGKNLYRVRLGPYTSEREAGYWLSLVKAIDGFGDSQIRQTTRQR
jgi:DedD protein